MRNLSIASTLLVLLPIAGSIQQSMFNPEGPASPLFSLLALAKKTKTPDKVTVTVPEPPAVVSKQLVTAPAPNTLLAVTAPVNPSSPRMMKLLVITATGTEPSFEAITYFLDHLGIPYQSVRRPSQPMPALTNGATGNFQGVILATGNPGLLPADWTALDNYAINYGVRTVAWYAWPEARYGIAWAGFSGGASDTTGVPMTYTAAAASVFPYLNRSQTLPLRSAWYYTANPSPLAGETTTPLLTVSGKTVAATHTKADGREYMAFTFDSAPWLIHSMAIQYGAFNWVTKGIFLGARKAYFSPQNDDHFLDNDLFKLGVAACMPSGFTNEPTYAPNTPCPTDRMDTGDITSLAAWQDQWNSTTQYRGFKLAMVYNGVGASATYGGEAPNNDALTATSIALKSKFFWINHTYDHEDLDCYSPVPNSRNCTPADYQESYDEIQFNKNVASRAGITLDATAMVTPGISGLNNPEFMRAAVNRGLKYLAADLSRPEGTPASPNTGIRSPLQSSILLVPRRAANVFYNTKAIGAGADGSLPDEYNYFWGPNGMFKRPDGTPWYATTQTWTQIRDREADALVSYMLRGEVYPVMFHQANLIRFSGSTTLFTAVVDKAFAKFSAISTLPVLSLSHSDAGKAMEARMSVNESQVAGTLYPGLRIELTSSKATTVPITGICKTACESYGGQSISRISLSGSTSIVLP